MSMNSRSKKSRKLNPVKGLPHSDYWKLWRIVDGAVRDAFEKHPEYLTDKGRRDARRSIVKRATGALLGSGPTVWRNRELFAQARLGSDDIQERRDDHQEAQSEAQ